MSAELGDPAEAGTQNIAFEALALHGILDCLPMAVLVKDKQGRVTAANKAAAQLIGTETTQALLGKTAFDFYPPERAAQIRGEELLLLGGGRPLCGVETVTDDSTGRKRTLRTTKTLWRDGVGVIAGIVEVVCDQSDGTQGLMDLALRGSRAQRHSATQQELEQELQREQSLLRTIIDSIPAKIYAKDLQSRFVACNALVAREMGTTSTEAIGKTDFDFFPPDMARGFYSDEQAVIRSRRSLVEREELVLDQVTGETRQIATTKVPFFDAAGNVLGIVGIGRDITERRRAEERIRYLATHDSMTDLPNRGIFSERLNASIRDAQSSGRRFAVLFIDLDQFKFVNDSLGHEAGDSLLKQTASRLRDCMHGGGLVARLGGDEFVVLCEDLSQVDINTLACGILQAVSHPMVLLGQECRVSASIGIAMYPKDGDTERTLMKSADIAMYAAKQEGKNNYRFYSAQIQAESLERTILETELRRAIERREFVIQYLPKFDLKSQRITGAEALLRWSHPDVGIIPPAKFLPLAEETGLIIPIGNWVLRTVCEQNMDWQRGGMGALCVSINVTARQFNHENFASSVLSAVRESGMAPHLLELEFSEHLLLHNPARTSAVLSELKRAGIRLAIDNFGASYLSLGSIKTLPIDTIKVDRSLLRDFERPDARAITDAIIAVGKSLSVTVIAAGVETVGQAEFAREHACDAMQGFYVSRPTGAEELAKLLRRQQRDSDSPSCSWQDRR